MKKLFALMLALVMALSLVGCEGAAPRPEPVPFEEEIVVVDDDVCKITVTDVNVVSRYTVSFLIENKWDKPIVFGAPEGYINGVFFSFPVDSEAFEDIMPGEQREITLSFTDLRNYGISTVTDINLSIAPLKHDEYNPGAYGEVGTRGTVQLYPYGEENAAAYTRVAKESDKVIVDNEYATVTVVGYGQLSEVKLHVVNHSDKELLICVAKDYAELNGIDGKGSLHCVVEPGAQSFGTLWPIYPGHDDGEVHEYIKTEFITFALTFLNEFGKPVYTSDMITLSPSGIKVTE